MNDSAAIADKLAVSSLALSVVNLLTYAIITTRASFALFAVATLGAWLLGIVALGIAVRARVARKSLARISITVALGYLIATSIVLLNVVVIWLRG